MIIDTLVTDRTQADVDRVLTLTQKWLDNTITSAEKAEWNNGLKGAYNAADLNRVGEAVAYIASILNSSGRAVSVTTKTNWARNDVPTATQMRTFLSNLSVLKSNVGGVGSAVPASMDNLTFETANSIEQLLIDVYNAIIRERADYPLCGMAISGVTGGL